eukprot:60539-Chlamydomonas_euryale.AAC.3
MGGAEDQRGGWRQSRGIQGGRGGGRQHGQRASRCSKQVPCAYDADAPAPGANERSQSVAARGAKRTGNGQPGWPSRQCRAGNQADRPGKGGQVVRRRACRRVRLRGPPCQPPLHRSKLLVGAQLSY